MLVAALALRLFGLTWDEGRDLHPDELFVAKIVLIDRIHFEWPPDWATLLDPATSGLNPRSADPDTGQFREFAYGALPLWVTDAAAKGVSVVTGTNWNDADHAYLVGRAISALLDTGTVLLTFLLARRLVSTRAGLVAAATYACAPMMIQLAHFFTTDSWLTFFVALCLLLAVRAASDGRLRWFAAAGFALGLAMATKGSVFTLAVAIGAAALAHDRLDLPEARAPVTRLLRALRQLTVAGVATVLGFGLFEPYALMRPDVYLTSLATQSNIVRGIFDVPFTRQYVGTTPVLYQAGQLIRWGFGPVAGVLALVGVLLMSVRLLRDRAWPLLVPLSWLVAYGVVITLPEVRFLRYLAPLAPVLAVAAGLAVVTGVDWLGRRFSRPLAASVGTIAVASIALWAVAFVSIYAQENPRLAASRWIYANVPDGSAITAEYWDDSLPRDFGSGLSPSDRQYATVTMDLYADRQPRDVADAIYADLQRADYVVLASNRVIAGTAPAPWRYPVQQAYYAALRSGALGFVPAATFTASPGIGPVRFDDRDADESFVNYDHPTVEIYRKVDLLTPAAYRALMAPAVAAPWSPTRHAPETASLMLDQPVGSLPVVADAGWSQAVTGSTLGAVVVWIGFLILLQALGLPLAERVLPSFADAGWGFARLLVVLAAGWAVWMLASLGTIAFRAVWVLVALYVTGLLSWFPRRRRPVRQRSVVIGAEIVFWAVFALFLVFRFRNPDSWHPIWGGEKPMEFAHLNATMRSAHFPPYDPWYAGGYINYYYYGLYLVAFMLKATGIPVEIGFNLAQPTVIALLAAAGFSVAATLGRDLARRPRLAVPAGLAAAAFLSVLGNLSSAATLLSGHVPPFDSFVDWVWAGSRAIPGTITEFPFFTGLYADLHAHVVALPVTVAAIACCYQLARGPSERFSLDGFGALRSLALDGIRRVLPLMLILGTLSATNAWDVPTYAALAVVAVVMWSAAAERWLPRAVLFVGLSTLLAFGSYVAFLPFHQHFVALFGSLARVKAPTDLGSWLVHLGGLMTVAIITLLVVAFRSGAGSASRAVWPPIVWASAVVVLLAVREFFTADSRVAGIATGLALLVVIALVFVGGWFSLQSRLDDATWTSLLPYVWLGAVGATTLAALVRGWDVMAIFLAVGALAGLLWMTANGAAARFTALLVAAAAFVGAGVEVFVVADDLISTEAYRMNTVFKFYNQIWVLLAIAVGAGCALMIAGTTEPAVGANPSPSPSDTSADGWPRAAERWSRLGLLALALVVAASAAYPVFAVSPRLDQRFADAPGVGTLDAYDWMRYGQVASIGPDGNVPIRFAGDLAAIRWLDENVVGTPVIAEASIGPYRCNGSRISIATGLPTILGWERHEEQQRWLEGLKERSDDVRTLYTSPDPVRKLAILRKYDVAYVVVGDVERRYPVPDNDCTPQGSAAGIAAFDKLVPTALEPVFSNAGTTIYRVLPPAGSTS